MITEIKGQMKNTEEAGHFFDTEELKADLKGRSIRGGAVTMAAQGARFVLRMGSAVVLARLLTPQDYGLIAMVTAVTGFVILFKDLGLSMATVQRAEINHGQISTLFWINVVLGLGVMLVTAALAPAIAWFYGEPRLTWITLALASAFVFGGLTIQHLALLKRQMRFGTLALIHIIPMLVGITTAIIAASYGAGYWALVLMELAEAITGAIAVWVACGWRPGLPVRGAGVRSMLAFGGHLTGFNVVNYFARNVDNILIGRVCGPVSLGLYAKAYGLLMLPITQLREPINSVVIPALSRIQDEPQRCANYYLKICLLLGFATMPLVTFMAVCSRPIILLFLGDQWVGASTVFQVLALAAFVQPVVGIRGLLLLSLGRSGRYLRLGLFNSLGVVASFFVGILWGVMGVAIAYTVVNYVLLIPLLQYSFYQTPLSIGAFLKAIARPLASSFVMAGVTLPVYWLLANQLHIVVIGVCLLVGLVAYLGSWILLPGGPRVLRELRSYTKLVPNRRGQTSHCSF